MASPSPNALPRVLAFLSATPSLTRKSPIHRRCSHRPPSFVKSSHSQPPSLSTALKPLPSPNPRYNDLSKYTVQAIRLTHCRTLSADLAHFISQKVRNKQASLSDLAAQLSLCDPTRAKAGDTGWYTVPSETPPPLPSSPATALKSLPLHPELLKHALTARPGALQTVHLSYGWEIYVVTDIRHAFVPTILGTKRGPGFPITHNMRRNSVKKPVIDPRSYFIQTFGCQMNVSDSERMAAELRRHGYHETPFAERSAVYVINTCALRDHAEQKVYSYLGPHAQRKWDAAGEVTLVVAGCVAQQEGERLLRRVPEVDVVMGPQYANRIGEVLEDFERDMTQIVAVEPMHIHEDLSKPVRGSTVTAWVNVIYGCLEKCSYCVVPNTRGVEQSRSMEAIRTEMKSLGKEGYREVVLLGQNVDAYGRDLYPRRTFADLLKFVHDVEGIERIRFTTGHPRYISDNLIEAVEGLPKVMEHFHIPPQSGDNQVLMEMRRGYTRERYVEIARRIRERMPDAAICADTIVGFPGESEDAFENTVDMIKEVVFDANMVRAYSARPNTSAGAREDQVDEKTKSRRLGVLNRLMREQALERSERYLGRMVEVLVEGKNEKNEKEVMGRERTNRIVFFEGEVEKYLGRIVKVLVQEAYAFSLRGRVVEEEEGSKSVCGGAAVEAGGDDDGRKSRDFLIYRS